MHECIAQLCVNFYYGSAGGKDPLARRYRPDFKDSIPEHAVIMAATCVSNTLPYSELLSLSISVDIPLP